MNVYVMTDIEGISGIYTKEQVSTTGSRFGEGRRFMTMDINACVKGLKKAGADKVYVCDCHGGSYSLLLDEATNDADGYICGYSPNKRYAFLDECDAIVLLGYHAMAGTAEAVLEHTFSSAFIQNMYYDGKKIGEIGIDTLIASEHGKKVIMVSGDDKACKEAEDFIENVVTCEVKKGISTFGALLEPLDKAHNKITDMAYKALKNFENVKMPKVDGKVTLKCEHVERVQNPRTFVAPYMKVIDARTFEVEANSVEEALYRTLL